MKNFTLTIIAIFFLSFAQALVSSESVYEGPVLSYSVEKTSGIVNISLAINNPGNFEEIKIERSDNPVKYFRQIKVMSASQINNLTGQDIVQDKYPLPSSQDSFYKLVTVDRAGVLRSYPSVKLTNI